MTSTPVEMVGKVKRFQRTSWRFNESYQESGHIVNRLLIPLINDAIQIFEEGLASVEGIDTAMKLGANHPMGPLALGDLIGLDVCLAIADYMPPDAGSSDIVRLACASVRCARQAGTGKSGKVLRK